MLVFQLKQNLYPVLNPLCPNEHEKVYDGSTEWKLSKRDWRICIRTPVWQSVPPVITKKESKGAFLNETQVFDQNV